MPFSAASIRYSRRPSAGRYLAVLACHALGLMSKTMLVTLQQPQSAASEAYRTLRTGVLFAAGQQHLKVLLMTSELVTNVVGHVGSEVTRVRLR